MFGAMEPFVSATNASAGVPPSQCQSRLGAQSALTMAVRGQTGGIGEVGTGAAGPRGPGARHRRRGAGELAKVCGAVEHVKRGVGLYVVSSVNVWDQDL